MARDRRYKSLQLFGRWFGLVGAFNLVLGIAAAAVLVWAASDAQDSLTQLSMLLGAVGVFAYALLSAVICWALAEAVDLGMDCEDHLRHLREYGKTLIQSRRQTPDKPQQQTRRPARRR